MFDDGGSEMRVHGYASGMAAGAGAGDQLGALAAKDTYGSLPSWNIVVICTVGGVLFFELICHQLNRAAAGKRHAQELLETLYRELAILGIVAFVLWSINVSPVVDIEYGDKHFFEQIHMALFLAALLHAFFVGVVALYSRQINRRWDVFEDDEMYRYKDLKQQHRRTAQRLGIRHADLKKGVGMCRSAWLSVRHPILYRRLAELSEHVGYHAIRAQFIKSHQLPKNFRFASYLAKCEQSVVLELAGIKEGVWVALIVFVGAELFVKGFVGQAESSQDVKPMFITGAVLVMLSAIVVHMKLNSIYDSMIRSYQASTDRRDDLMQFLGLNSSNTMRQEALFWFSRPGLMLLALQSMQFLLAIMVGALIWFGRTDSTGIMILAEVVLGVGAFGIYTIVLPKFIPKFTTVTHVGAMVNLHILRECLEKQKKAFQHRALPPTLRQVSNMARMKANYKHNGGRVVPFPRKCMSGHRWREFTKVVVTIHFFVVASNTDPVRSDMDTRKALIAEVSLGSLALLMEILTHFVVWKGKACFRCSCFVDTHEDEAVDQDKQAVSMSDGSVSRGDVERGGGATVTPAPEGDNAQKLLSTRKGGAVAADHPRDDDWIGEDDDYRRCSLWACFGWNGVDRPTRLFSVPPSARVGWWRTIDFLLVAVVAGESIISMIGYLFGDDYRVVHAFQGLVIFRWVPLMCCPFPPADGHNDRHDSEGATVHHNPLNQHALEETFKETLELLRRQNKLSVTLNSNMALVGGVGVTVADADQLESNMMKSAFADDEKGDALDPKNTPRTDGIANVGVAVALCEACTAHPDLVKSHGPLSAPILRVMLGLDPNKTTHEDDVQALDVAVSAVTRRLPRTNSSTTAVVDGAPGVRYLRRLSSGASGGGDGVPTSPSRRSNSSSSSSELSTSEEEGEGSNRKGSNASRSISRGGLSNWTGHASRSASEPSQPYRQHHHLADQLQQKQPLTFQQQQQQQQQVLYHQQQIQLYYQLFQQQRMAQQDTMGPMERDTVFHTDGVGRDASHVGPAFPNMPGRYMAPLFPSIGGYGLGGGAMPPAFEPTGGYQMKVSASSSHSRRSTGVIGKLTSSSRHRRGHRHRRRSGSGGSHETPVVPPAIEDIERPVLRSLSSFGDESQHGHRSEAVTPRTTDAGGFSVPSGSGRSIPFSSSHHAARLDPRGTPGMPYRYRRSRRQGSDPVPEGDVQGLDFGVPGTSDAMLTATSAVWGGELSFTPAYYTNAAAGAAARGRKADGE